VSSAISTLKSYGVNTQTILYEEMGNYSKDELRRLSKDKGFSPIWEGGILRGAHLTLKVQVSEDAWGRLLYNGKLFNRRQWSYQPPKFIRLQGRLAKEFTSFYNNYPTDVIEIEGQKVRIRRMCDNIVNNAICGGKLEYDPRGFLFCTVCDLESK
jgi:hypothetical protein